MINTDVVIIGAGPVGLFTVHQLGIKGLSAEVIDNLDKAGGQCIELYPDKPIYDIPAIPECSGEELTKNLLKQIKAFNPKFHFNERVEELKEENGKWVVKTNKGKSFSAPNIIIAGGFENMSQAPYILPKARAGYRLGNGRLIDSMINDGLWDVYNDIHMGNCAEICARERNYSINDQNDFAKESYHRAIDAQKSGAFTNEIISVNVENRSNTIIFKEDEEPKNVNFDKMDKLSPAFEEDGSITAANASKINDGAACLLLMSENKASELGLKPLARILYQSSAAHDPKWFTTAPIKAIKKILIKANMEVNDIDLWEINEAFAPVVMSVMDDYNLDHDKINVNGGAIALGHPIGASGARILTTLIHAWHHKDISVGLATLCIGGGEASALILERVN